MRDKKDSFVSQEHWDAEYADLSPFVAPKGDAIRIWLEGHFASNAGSRLELGCFPGRYLAVFGELGYEVNGIDLTPGVEMALKQWMQAWGYRTGQFVRADVWTYPFNRQFDVVCSFGLIEHFGQWPKLLTRHAELVRPNGFLAVSAPNFRGFVQRFLHRWLDRGVPSRGITLRPWRLKNGQMSYAHWDSASFSVAISGRLISGARGRETVFRNDAQNWCANQFAGGGVFPAAFACAPFCVLVAQKRE